MTEEEYWAEIERIRQMVPDEVWERMPTDAAERIDDYLEGTYASR